MPSKWQISNSHMSSDVAISIAKRIWHWNTGDTFLDENSHSSWQWKSFDTLCKHIVAKSKLEKTSLKCIRKKSNKIKSKMPPKVFLMEPVITKVHFGRNVFPVIKNVIHPEQTEHRSIEISVIFVSVQPSSTTLFGEPFPLPTPQGRRDSQKPECEIRQHPECCIQYLSSRAYSCRLKVGSGRNLGKA